MYHLKMYLKKKRIVHFRVHKIFAREDQQGEVNRQTWSPRGCNFEVLGLGLEDQVFGLGLEASSSRKLACSQLEDSTFFELLKFCRSSEKKF